jgi:hypothetical protein
MRFDLMQRTFLMRFTVVIANIEDILNNINAKYILLRSSPVFGISLGLVGVGLGPGPGGGGCGGGCGPGGGSGGGSGGGD